MTSEHENRDFDFGYQTGINKFAQQGIETANTISQESDTPIYDDDSPSPIYAIIFLVIIGTVFALPYFF